jgi:hypothetical protein
MRTGGGALLCTSYGLFAIFWYARPQAAPSLDYGAPLITGSALCVVTRWKAMSQQSSQGIQWCPRWGRRYQAHEARSDVTCTRTTRDAGRRQMRGEATIPMEGPPRTRMISLDEPPSSDTGRTYVARANAAQIALHPVPPDMTRYDSHGLVLATPEVLSCRCCGGDPGRCPGISRCGRCAARGAGRS